MPETSFIEGVGQASAAQAANNAVGAIFGLAMEGHNDKRQIKQQQKLTDMQAKANREQAMFSKQLQMDMWNETNYGAQMKHLKEAGLNPGLIYGMKGGGGVTTGSASAGGVSGANAPSGGGEMIAQQGMGIQLALMDAQRRNIEADTKVKEGEAANKPLQGQEIISKISDIAATITNKAAQTRLMSIEADIKDIDREVAGRTIDDQVDIITGAAGKAAYEVKLLQRQNAIQGATVNEAIGTIKAEYIGALLRNANTAQDTKLKGAQTATEQEKPYLVRQEAEAIGRKILQEDDRIINEGRRISIEEIKTLAGDKNISAEIINAIQSILLIKAAASPGKPNTVTGFKVK